MEYKKIRPKKRKFKSNKVLYIFLLFLFIGIGYAALTTSLSITGTTNVATNSWNIHFANLHVQGSSVEANAPTVSSNSISYAATLAQPGDFYEFSVDIKNDGTLPGKISLVSLTGNSTSYLSTSYAYSNGQAITIGDIINAGKSKRITIKAWIPSDIDTSLLPTEDTPITLTFNLQYIQSEQDLAPDATDQLIALAKTNSCMTKYEGNVTDKVGVTEQATRVYFDRCADKRNIKFAGYCWQVIRTTETGGIKMIYNGEPVDGKCASTRINHKGIVGMDGTGTNIASEYLYGSSFTYDTTNNYFTLVDTTLATWSDSTYKNLLGKFTCMNTNGTCTTLYNVNGYYDSSVAYTTSYTIGDTNYAQIGTSSYNANTNSPAMVGYMFNKVYKNNSNAPTSGSLMGNDVSYSNGTYTLLPADGESELGTTKDDTHHYTCNNTTGTCTKVRYYYTDYYYIELDGAENIQAAVNEMLYNNDVNTYNSSIKGVIDSWYVQNLSSKTSMLEDTVYCNARNMINQSTNGWNKDGSLTTYMNFKNYNYNNDISCINITDQFAAGNNKAKLTYPVALATREELYTLTDNNNSTYFSTITNTGAEWLSLSPSDSDGANVRYVYSNGFISDGNVHVFLDYGVRPVVSLSTGTVISEGTGSEDSPWIIQE